MQSQAQFRAFERLVMPGPVTASHADAEDECASCHVRFERDSQVRLCLDCHEQVDEDLQTNSGFHGLSADVAATECADCHTDHEGRDADILGLDTEAFDHNLTDFPLLGAHTEANCEGCHAPEQTFHDAATECVSCHIEDDQHLGRLGESCNDCHTETAWTETLFDHDAVTDYPLTGGHLGLACVSCHVDEQYEDTPNQCGTCHLEDDTHSGNNGTDCQTCHTADDWSNLLFDHAAMSNFALLGSHSDLTCESCHSGNKFEQTLSTQCVGCHIEDDAHDAINGEVCGDCHQVTEWLDVTFNHASDAEFQLLGAHSELVCADCHIEPTAVGLPGNACYDCHSDDDPHEMQLGETCSSCHNETGFDIDVRFDHALTSFPLLGRHADVVCEDCHSSHAFLDAPQQCVDCHSEDDVHEHQLGSDCALCHNPNDWLLWQFDHSAQTAFPLDGAHDNLDCLACHREPADTVTAVSTACGSCHRRDDEHRGEFGQDCQQCHTTEAFDILRDVQ